MAGVIVPRVARVHYQEAETDFHTTVTGIDENEGLNRVFKAISDAATLAEAIAFILAILAPLGADDVVKSAAPVGDLHALAAYITTNYPSGFIPALP